MGKIRVKTLGVEELEEQQKKKTKEKREQKLARVPGLKGGQRVVVVGPTEEELSSVIVNETNQSQTTDKKEVKKEKKAKPGKKKTRSKSYQVVAKFIDKNKKYSISEALDLLPKLGRARFDETVDLHINTTENGLSGSLTLPHGSGKQLRVAIADDKLIADIEKGKVEFDILLSAPQMMPKLAKVARVLGPKGLMPNPKNGTVSEDPKRLAQSFAKGQVNFKTESKNPIIHLAVGKISFGDKKLAENIQSVFQALKTSKIKNATLKSTMSLGIKLDIATVN